MKLPTTDKFMGPGRKLLLAAVLIMACTGCADHLKEGVNAYKEKNFAVALKELQPLADRGDAEAQLFVGFMYDNGEGVQLDYRQAVMWYQKSAEQGNAQAQYNLGMMYANGLGVQQDMVQALKWFNLAALLGRDEKFVKTGKQAETMMSPEQVKTAWAQAKEWQEKHK